MMIRVIFVFICLLPAVFLPADSAAQQAGKIFRIGFLDSSTASGMAVFLDAFKQLRELSPAALALKLKLEEIETQRDAKGLETAFQTATTFFTERKGIVELAGKYRLPAIYFQKEFVDASGPMFYGAESADLYRRAATYVDKILKGAKPADMPVEQPTKFELIINLKAAKEIDLTFPPNVLARADRVIR